MSGTQGPSAHPHYVEIHKQIGNKSHLLRLKSQRFESTMNQIDRAVGKGATHKQIMADFASHMHTGEVVAPAAPEKPAAKLKSFSAVSMPAKAEQAHKSPASSKADTVRTVMSAMKGTPSQVAKRVHQMHPDITYANAYFYARKFAAA